MGTVLRSGIFNTRVILSGMQGNRSHTLQHYHRHGRQVGVRERQQHAPHAELACPLGCGTDEPHVGTAAERPEAHTSELQSPYELVCRLLLEQKNIHYTTSYAGVCLQKKKS